MRGLRQAWRVSVVVLLLVAAAVVPAVPAAAEPLLRQGARGPAVTQLQTRLAELRYDVGAIDGVFGPSTANAVVAFQKVNGLSRDGIVGPRTRAALQRPRTPKLRNPRSGRSVEVDLTRQVLYQARDGRLVRIYNVSSGKASTPTPVGHFRVERRIDGWRTSHLGRLWRPAYFRGGYALHGYTSIPSYPASSGCVRLPIPSMNRLWPHVSVGTPVHIYR